MPIKGDTALSSFSGKELAESSAIHGDFNQASINYSGHQNLEVRGAEALARDWKWKGIGWTPEEEATLSREEKEAVAEQLYNDWRAGKIKATDVDEYYERLEKGAELVGGPCEICGEDLFRDYDDSMGDVCLSCYYKERSKQDDEGSEYDGWLLNFAESFGAEDMDGRVVNIVGVEDKVYVTIRFPDTHEHYGYDKIFVGEMEDVMLAESFGADAEEYTVVMSGFLTDDGSGEKEFTGTEQELKDMFYDFMMEDRFDKLLWETDGDEEEAERIDLERWNKKSLEQICDDNEYLTLRKSFGAEYGKRQRFGNRYVARDTKGKFISNVSVGRSLKADRRNKSKTPARSGFGHKGDAQKGASGGFKLPTDAKSLVGIGAVLGGLWAYLESKA